MSRKNEDGVCRKVSRQFFPLASNNEAFRKELTSLLNTHSMENGSDTSDRVLAVYLVKCLENFDLAVRDRGVSCPES